MYIFSKEKNNQWNTFYRTKQNCKYKWNTAKTCWSLFLVSHFVNNIWVVRANWHNYFYMNQFNKHTFFSFGRALCCLWNNKLHKLLFIWINDKSTEQIVMVIYGSISFYLNWGINEVTWKLLPFYFVRLASVLKNSVLNGCTWNVFVCQGSVQELFLFKIYISKYHT